MDFGMLQGAIVGLKSAADIAIALNNIKTMAEVQAKAIELQQVILSAQSSALAAQSEKLSLLQSIRELEEEVARVKAWSEEKQRYALVAPFEGSVVYALKKESAGTEPPHWICASCYEKGCKGILHYGRDTITNAQGMECPLCKTHLASHYRGTIRLAYAEDIKAA